MKGMESPSFFADCVDLDIGSTTYPDTFQHGRDGTPTTYDQGFGSTYEHHSKMAGANVLFPAPSSRMMETSKLGMWNATVTTTELHEPDMVDMVPQQMFVQPRTFLAHNNQRDASPTVQSRESNNFTPITTPELQPSSRRTSSIKSEPRSSPRSTVDELQMTDITPPEPSPPKRRKTTRRTKKEAAAATVEDGKRHKFLERNRVAASKCREKKKMFVSELEQTKIDLESQHSRLQLEYNGLLSEVSSLKHTLMVHAKCNDTNIDSWIANEAKKFVQTSQLLGKNPYAALDDEVLGGKGSTIGVNRSTGVVHSRNPSTASSVAQYPGHRPSEGSSGAGYGSFSSAADGTNARGGSSSSSGDRRHSIAYSQAASPTIQMSPTDMLFPRMGSPSTATQEPSMNFDHMPDDMFDNE